MAVIGKLRKRAGLLIILLGFAIVAFILPEVVKGLEGGGQDNIVGTIMGDDIEYAEYSKTLQNEETKYKFNLNQASLDDRQRFDIAQYTWDKMVNEKALGEQYSPLGLEVNGLEWEDMYSGNNVHPQIKSSFTDPETGQFSPETVIQFVLGLEENSEEEYRWNRLKEYLIKQRQDKRFESLHKKSIYVPNWEARENNINKELKAEVSYVFLPYSETTEEFDISDEDIEGYYQSNINKYEAKDEKRRIEYVQFRTLPSKEDSLYSMQEILEYKNGFLASKDDSGYVTRNSEVPFANVYYTEEEINSIRKDSIMSAVEGTIIGPYLEEDQFMIAKVMGVKKIPDSIEARHILIKVQTQEEYNEAIEKMDSIKQELKEGADFTALAKAISQEPGSKDSGGELGWVKPGQMVKPFNDALFYNGDEKGYQVVLSQFGLHLIDVQTYRPSKKGIKIGYISSKISARDRTVDSVFARANEFYYSVMKSEGKEGAEQLDAFLMNNDGFNKRTPDAFTSNTYEIPGVGAANQLVKWAFKSDLGALSLEEISNSNNYFVVTLADIESKEVISENARVQIENELRKEKQSKELMLQNKAALSLPSLEEVASALGKEIQQVSNVSFDNAYNPGIGRDLMFTGQACGLELGVLSKPFMGEKGVYIIKVNSRSELVDKEDYSVSANGIRLQQDRSATNRASEAILKYADSEDFRFKF
jgi:peptidyl-prolyl cis-trans isomerase D